MRVFDEYSQCPKCGYRRGPETKPMVAYCDGQGQRGQSTCDVPDALAEAAPKGDHLHRQCPRCQFVWAEACPSVAVPLSVEEIAILREVIAQVTTSNEADARAAESELARAARGGPGGGR
jgi:hypothetical protein